MSDDVDKQFEVKLTAVQIRTIVRALTVYDSHMLILDLINNPAGKERDDFVKTNYIKYILGENIGCI